MSRKTRKRANGEGSIYQIKSGSRKGMWVAQVTIGTDPKTGRLKRKSFYGKTRREVKEKMDDYLDLMNQGLDIETAKRLTFGEWLIQWLELYKRPNVKITTYEGYKGHIERTIVPALGHITLADLTTDDIQALYTRLQQDGKSPSYIQNIHKIINPCLQKAADNRLIQNNPASRTERPAVRKSSGKAMSEADMQKFMAVVDDQDDRWRAAFLTLMGTGLRVGELLALEWDDIDLENGLISVNKTLSRTKGQGLIVDKPKTAASEATVPMPNFVIKAIKRHKVSQAAWALKKGEEYQNRKIVFASLRGTYMSPRNFQRKHYELVKKAGIEHINVHGLRHTYATRLLEQGENLRVVQELLRHANISTTGDIYSHVTVQVKKQAAQKMDNLLGEKLS